MKNKICGEFPEFCYRAFDHQNYAEQFVNSGKFRMGCRFFYKEVEDESRRDPTEGSGHTLEPGVVTVGWVSPDPAKKTIWTKEMGYQEHHIESNNAIFCFCTCLPDVDLTHMLEAFGKYIVKINDPRKLAEDINDYFINSGQKFIIEGCNVVYNKGQKQDGQLERNERLGLSYKQKPESFSPDCEFRIAAIKLMNASEQPCELKCKYLSGQSEPCRFIEVDLNKPLHYTQLGWSVP